MAAYPVKSFEVYEDLLDSLELSQAQFEEAKALLKRLEDGDYVQGVTPKIWGQYALQVLGKAGGQAFDQFAEALGVFRLGQPMSMRDVLVVSMWLWRKVFPELSMAEGCRRVIRVCIEGITKSPGFGILLMVLDQGLVEVVKMSEAITIALTSFHAKVDVAERGVVKVALTEIDYEFMTICLVGYFEGLLDLSKVQGEVTCIAQGKRAGLLTIRYTER